MKVTIFKTVFVVKRSKNRSASKKYYGQCWLRKRRKGSIRLYTGAKGRKFWTTLFHELLHAMAFAGKFNLSEKKVMALEEAYSDFCARNPKLAATLAKELAQ